jgi:hypothetical protein
MPERISDEHARLLASAMLGQLERSVWPLYMRNKVSGRYYLGTGQVIDVQGTYFLCTAAHNLRPIAEIELGVARPGIIRRDTVFWLDKHTVHGAGGRDNDTVDVAIVELSKATLDQIGIEPIPLSMIAHRPLVDHEITIAFGFPAKLAPQDPEKEQIVSRYMAYVTVPKEAAEWPPRYEPAHHHILEYPKHEVWKQEGNHWAEDVLPPAQGMSGCGIWAMPGTAGKIISYKDLQLLGFVYAQYKDMLIGNSSVLMLALMHHAFPSVRPALAAIGFGVTDPTAGEPQG